MPFVRAPSFAARADAARHRGYVRPSGKSVFAEEGEKSLPVTQEMPFPTTLYLSRGAEPKEPAMAEQSCRAKFRSVLARTRSVCAMLCLAHESLDIFIENVGQVRRFAKAGCQAGNLLDPHRSAELGDAVGEAPGI